MPFTPTWTEATLPVGFGPSVGVWSESRGLFVLLGYDTGTNTTSVFTSPEGDIWTLVHTFPLGDNYSPFEYSPVADAFLAVNNTDLHLYRSTDLVTWTDVVTPPASPAAIIWDDARSQFVVIPNSCANAILTSPDGITFTTHAGPWTDDPLDTPFGIVCTGLSTLIIFLNDADAPDPNLVRAFSSTDGFTWTATAFQLLPAFTTNIHAVSGHYYVAGQTDDPDNPSGVADFDGISWTFNPVYPTTGGLFVPPYLLGVFKNSDGFVAMPYESPLTDDIVWLSDDIITWTLQDIGNANATWFPGAMSDAGVMLLLSFIDNRTMHSGASTPPPPPFPPRPVFDAPIRRQPAIGITETRGQFDTAKFTAGEEDGTMPAMMPAPGQDITIDFNDGFGRQFGGTVQSVEMIYEDDGEIDQLAFNVFATGYGYRLNRRRPFMCFTNLPLDQAVKRMIAAFGNPTGEIEFTDVNVDEDLPPITMELDGSKSFCECMDAMCESAGCKWRVDYNTPCNIYVQLI